MKLALIDMETTGLEPLKHRVVEAAVLIVDVTKAGIVRGESFSFLQRIDKGRHKWEQGAFNVNGYDDAPGAEWHDAPMVDSLAAVKNWQKFCEMTSKLPLCSQNVPFDRGFLESEARYHGCKLSCGRRFVDIMSFSFLVAVKYDLTVFGLQDVFAKEFPDRALPAHRAQADIERGLALLEKNAALFLASEVSRREEPAVAAGPDF